MPNTQDTSTVAIQIHGQRPAVGADLAAIFSYLPLLPQRMTNTIPVGDITWTEQDHPIPTGVTPTPDDATAIQATDTQVLRVIHTLMEQNMPSNLYNDPNEYSREAFPVLDRINQSIGSGRSHAGPFGDGAVFLAQKQRGGIPSSLLRGLPSPWMCAMALPLATGGYAYYICEYVQMTANTWLRLDTGDASMEHTPALHPSSVPATNNEG